MSITFDIASGISRMCFRYLCVMRSEEGVLMSERFPLPDIEMQVDLVERKGIGDLLRCPNAWALRHRFINQDTGNGDEHGVTVGIACTVVLVKRICGGNWSRRLNQRCSERLQDQGKQ